jgi:gp16 family phage-associated protein
MKVNPEDLQWIRDWFDAKGLSISDWSAEHGFKREHVYAFLSGRTGGNRGVSHHIAVALLLKSDPGPLQPRSHVRQSNPMFVNPPPREESMKAIE